MKALSTTILIVVTAVVILVAALVLLTIFSGGIGNVGTLTNFRTQCAMQCSTTCKIGSLPPTWNIETTVAGTKTSCAKEYTSGCSDSACGGVASSSNLDSHGCYIGQAQWCSTKNKCIPLSTFSSECSGSTA